jgi:hypothetical protein
MQENPPVYQTPTGERAHCTSREHIHPPTQKCVCLDLFKKQIFLKNSVGFQPHTKHVLSGKSENLLPVTCYKVTTHTLVSSFSHANKNLTKRLLGRRVKSKPGALAFVRKARPA